jgi:hypothetical protein
MTSYCGATGCSNRCSPDVPRGYSPAPTPLRTPVTPCPRCGAARMSEQDKCCTAKYEPRSAPLTPAEAYKALGQKV